MSVDYQPIAKKLAAALRLRPCTCVRAKAPFPHRSHSPDFKDEICHMHKLIAEFDALDKSAGESAK